MKYIDKDDFYYELFISKGKGQLTKNAENMMIKIAFKMIKKFENNYVNKDDMNDCVQQGMMMMFLNWDNFNSDKYDNPFPYFSEICKRGIADGLTQLYEESRYKKWSRTNELVQIRKEKRTSISGNKNK